MKLSPRQCRTARSLLKWNYHDLSSKSGVAPKRIEEFERATLHLQKSENDELVDTFHKQGIEFKADFQVVLTDGKGKSTSSGHRAAPKGDGQTIVIDSDNWGSQAGDLGSEEPPTPVKRPINE